MTVWFVTRHAGAVEWARRRGVAVDRVVEHLDPAEVEPGDTVVGTLPVHLAAEVCARGARYRHLILPLSRDRRGGELTALEMEAAGGRLEDYAVYPAPGPADRDEPEEIY